MKSRKNAWKAMSLYSAILAQLTGSVLIGIFAGRWLDGIWNSEPLGLIVGLLIGLAAGIFSMLRTVKYFDSEE
ncbi:ATP synthase protein I [Bacillus thermotolerans]|uniref:ATP synthase protein I n=2 Tax=Bacillus thermotolerans TaxID=1221996 RepID=A0A0F5I6B4_BACTR|nr:AtpZ/AtpI family protein [Bacillus thermotolerans]KKB36525.1 ATP synthase protein I [Bacillus thermotolerans]KKB41008.1 ATP synthase protein I [Bacillus thermotolerans]KKB44927.1 ATP synthase protein I [Bacillus thermotolerans]